MATVHLFTEDSSSHAFATIKALSCELLKLVDSRSRPQRLDFKPVIQNHKATVSANNWRSGNTDHQQEITTFLRYVATTLAQKDSFVFFHMDGDKPWSKREQCEVIGQFERIVINKVTMLLKERATPERLARLFKIMPFYSIETWLYQNTSVAIEICKAKYANKHTALFEQWSMKRDEVDEIIQIKDQTCLGSKHNQELAESNYPTAEVFNIEKSFTETVWLLDRSETLKAALEETRRPGN